MMALEVHVQMAGYSIDIVVIRLAADLWNFVGDSTRLRGVRCYIFCPAQKGPSTDTM